MVETKRPKQRILCDELEVDRKTSQGAAEMHCATGLRCRTISGEKSLR